MTPAEVPTISNMYKKKTKRRNLNSHIHSMGICMLGFDTFDIMVWARNFVIQNTWAEPNCSNPNLGFILEGGGYLVQIF